MVRKRQLRWTGEDWACKGHSIFCVRARNRMRRQLPSTINSRTASRTSCFDSTSPAATATELSSAAAIAVGFSAEAASSAGLLAALGGAVARQPAWSWPTAASVPNRPVNQDDVQSPPSSDQCAVRGR